MSNNKEPMSDRDGLYMAATLLFLTASKGDEKDVAMATVAIDPAFFNMLIDKFGDEAFALFSQLNKASNKSKPLNLAQKKTEFLAFSDNCFFHDIDPKFCTCYKHKGNEHGRAECMMITCPLYDGELNAGQEA